MLRQIDVKEISTLESNKHFPPVDQELIKEWNVLFFFVHGKSLFNVLCDLGTADDLVTATAHINKEYMEEPQRNKDDWEWLNTLEK